MSWPSGPPPMPAPGWYADPEQAWTWRFWDGTRWSDHRAPMAAPRRKDPYSFSAWFEESTATVKAVIRSAGVAVLLVVGACAVALGAIVRQATVSRDGRELRALLDLDGIFSGSSSTVELTDAEADRVVDLLGDLARTWLPWFVVVCIVFTVATVWASVYAARAAGRQVSESVDVRPDGEMIVSDESTTIGAALARVPAVFLAYLVTTVLIVLAVVVPLLPMIGLLAVDGGGAAIALSMVFGILAAIAVVFWIAVRLSLVVVIAAVGGHGLGVGRSWELTRGHFWGTFARLLVAGLIASIATAPLNFIGSFGLALGFTTMLVLLVILQTLSIAATALVTVPATVVLVDHLDAQQQLATR